MQTRSEAHGYPVLVADNQIPARVPEANVVPAESPGFEDSMYYEHGCGD